MADVIVVGGGPTGMMLAAELRLQNIDVVVIERDLEPPPFVRSLGLHVRSIEILDMRGLLDGFLEQGTKYPLTGFFAGISKPAPPDLDTAHGYVLGIPQTLTDRLLADHAAELGTEIRRGVELTGLSQSPDQVVAELSDGTSLTATYLVGCDGGRSLVRKLTGITFPGEPSRVETLLGEFAVTSSADEIAAAVTRIRESEKRFGLGPASATTWRVVVPAAGLSTESPTLADFQHQLIAYAGTDFGIHAPTWMSRFGDATRLASQYRKQRVFLAGDAAHIHPPIGGQGLNLGIQDAVNLGWKLACATTGFEELLDTYETERRPVADDVLSNTRAMMTLVDTAPGPQAVRRLFSELMDIGDVNRYLIEKLTAIGIRYDLGYPNPLVGRRLRDVAIGPARLFELLRSGRGLLLDQTGTLSASAWTGLVDQFSGELPELPEQTVLLRPDGHIAWASSSQSELDAALTRWFGRAGT